MDRRPVYHRDTFGYRIVSRPNDQWVAQERVTEGKGRNAEVRGGIHHFHFDPWQDLHSPTSRDEAIRLMYQHKPAQQ